MLLRPAEHVCASCWTPWWCCCAESERQSAGESIAVGVLLLLRAPQPDGLTINPRW
jgi:hypothetical protein